MAHNSLESEPRCFSNVFIVMAWCDDMHSAAYVLRLESRLKCSFMAQQVSAARDVLVSLHILFWKFWMLYIQKPFTVARFFLTLYLVM